MDESALRTLEARWLGRVPYREAWDLQHRLVEARAAGRIGDQLILLEHPPILTLGRHADPGHVRADPAELERLGIDVIRVERGGEVTYHGPGQLVGYPILHLAGRGLLLRPFVRALEAALADTCAAFGVAAGRRDGYPGCWCDPDDDRPRKIGALGIRLERGITYHGIALNVSLDLAAFGLIDACGMPGVRSTSIEAERAVTTASTVGTDPADASAGSKVSVYEAALLFATALGRRLPAAITGSPFAAEPRDAGIALDKVLAATPGA